VLVCVVAVAVAGYYALVLLTFVAFLVVWVRLVVGLFTCSVTGLFTRLRLYLYVLRCYALLLPTLRLRVPVRSTFVTLRLLFTTVCYGSVPFVAFSSACYGYVRLLGSAVAGCLPSFTLYVTFVYALFAIRFFGLFCGFAYVCSFTFGSRVRLHVWFGCRSWFGFCGYVPGWILWVYRCRWFVPLPSFVTFARCAVTFAVARLRSCHAVCLPVGLRLCRGLRLFYVTATFYPHLRSLLLRTRLPYARLLRFTHFAVGSFAFVTHITVFYVTFL